jgi:agmatine/peptidylarginine deiminase
MRESWEGRNWRKLSRGAVLLLAFLLLLLAAAGLRAQSAPGASEHKAKDVVMLALQAMNPRVELQQQVQKGLMGGSDAELNVEKRLLEMQMNIVRETAKFGPVLLLAPDETTKSAVQERCKEFQICELLRSDRVRIKAVAHDGVWIRDFGPQIESAGDSASVAHWRYFDVRTEEAKKEKLQELEAARLRLLETRQQEDQPDALTQGTTADEHKAAVSAIDAKIYILREFAQLLNETSPQRTNDENSAYDIADAVLANPDFAYKSSPMALDGGNLLKLEDGRCLTTRVLLSRNKDQNVSVDQELEKVGGCKKVTYLEPLPGPVTEHIDMFALPVGGKRILLASYDLSQPFAQEYWSQLSSAERDLALDAELAMKENAERLTRLGYEVVLVSSPFPRVPSNGHIYYPSVLNALVRTAADGYREVLLPAYRDYQPDIQAAARKQIEAAFGPKTDFATIESTEAAKSQGAVHCLTLSAPLQVSIFGDAADSAQRTEALARKEQLDRSAETDLSAQIPANGLQGSWAILGANEQAEQGSPGLYPQRIFFGESEFQKGVFDQLEAKGTYTIDKKERALWSLHLLLPDQDVTPAVVQWINKDEVKLTLENGGSALVLRRIAAGGVSPFKSDAQSLPQTGKGSGAGNKKDSKSSKPAPSTGQAGSGSPQH